MGQVLYAFYLSKALDFMDTAFIILNQRWKQLSFLHVYHHFMTFGLFWVNSRVAYDGAIYVSVLLNSSIHFVMYTYYFLSQHTRDIWWKQYLTMLQILQFVAMIAHSAGLLYQGCIHFPLRPSYWYFVYVQSLLWLFVHFFITAYCFRPRRQMVAKKMV